MSELILPYLYSNEVKELKDILHSNDLWHTQFNADYDVMETYFLEVVDETIKWIVEEKDFRLEGCKFICGYNSLYDTIEMVFNEDQDSEFFNESVDIIIETINDLVNHVLYNRNLWTNGICYYFEPYSDGLVLCTDEYLESIEDLM